MKPKNVIRTICLAVVVMAALTSVRAASNPSEPLSFEQRLEAQRKIERVYHEHRIWPASGDAKPAFEDLVTDEILDE